MIDPNLLAAFDAKSRELGDRELCEESLYEFLKRAWKYIDPAPFVGGWHLEAIAEHLQAVTDGHIRRLIINVPPRTSKSSLISVAYPAWIWAQSHRGPLSGPHVQFLSASYAHTLSLRDSVKMRRLIASPWYQKHWGSRFQMTGDVNTKGRFENTAGGYRLATSVDGTTTGEGGDLILADDANSATEVESDAVRDSTNRWWSESMSTRLNDAKTGAFIVVQQRLHQNDLTGHIMSGSDGKDYVWLMLPMEHDIQRHCVTYLEGQKFWEDPRKEDGEMLCPERFGKDEIDSLSKRLGPFAASGQLQQSPVPRGGGIIKEEWWGQYLETTYPPFEFILASLDTAYTEKEENDPSALTIWGVYRNENNLPRIMLIYGWQDRLTLPDLIERVHATCTTTNLPDTSKYKYSRRFRVDRLLIESKASGISVYQELQRVIGFNTSFSIELFNPTKLGDKQARVYSIQHLFSEGLVYVPWPVNKDGEFKGKPADTGYKWAEEIIDQVTVFPRGSHDDLCFVAGTQIATRYGSKSIEKIVVGDEVLTPIGWRRVKDCGFTGVRPVISRFGLTGTSNHPVFTVDSGYVALDSVVDSTTLSRLKICDMMKIVLLKSLNLMVLPTAEWEANEDIISLNQNRMLGEGFRRGFMLLFGNIILEKRFLMGMKSIIRMVILLTLCLKIWSAYRARSIVDYLKDILLDKWNILKELGRWLLHGINLRLAVSGIGNMPTNLSKNLDIKGLLWRLLGSVNVFGVEQSLPLRVKENCFVGGNALIRDRDIYAEERKQSTNTMPVFNLTVEGANCYYANGILVHNCDSMSQALRWLRDSGVLQRSEEYAFDVHEEMVYRGRPKPLYPV